MKPRPSGGQQRPTWTHQQMADATGGTAADPVDITSDTEAVSSDAPRIIPLTARTAQSSGSDVVEISSAKRVREAAKAIQGDDSDEASTSQLSMSELRPPKRSRRNSHEAPPQKRKSTARKSTQHVTTAQRLRLEATGRGDTQAEESDDNIPHEEAMRQAAADRRRSQSARRASLSPSRAEVAAGPGPNTLSQRSGKFVSGNGDEHDPEATATFIASSPVQIGSSTSECHPAPASQSHQDEPKPVLASSQKAGSKARPSPFQVLDTPGSWGHAVPMSVSVPPRPKPRSRSPIPHKAGEPSAPVTEAPLERESEGPAKPRNDEASVPKTSVLNTSSKPIRQGPTWRTEPDPVPEPSQIEIMPLPSDPIDADESDGDQSQSLRPKEASSRHLPRVRCELDDNGVITSVRVGDTEFVPSSPLSALPSLPSLPSSFMSEDQQVYIPARRTFTGSVVLSDSTVPEEIQITLGPMWINKPNSANERSAAEGTVEKDVEGPHIDTDAGQDSIEPIVESMRQASLAPSSPVNDLQFKSVLTSLASRHSPSPVIDHLTATSPELTTTLINNTVIEIDDGSDAHPSGASSSGDSIEEIPAEIARTQVIFTRHAGGQSSGRPRALPISIVTEKRMLRSGTMDVSTEPQAGSSRPRRYKSDKASVAPSSSSSSGSPSKRSSRLAARTLAPVYSFKRTGNPIQWRQTIEMDGESDVEDLLRPPSSANSTASSSMTIDGVHRTISGLYTIPTPIIDTPPPDDRRSAAVRTFDTQLIDDWNRLSPTLTHNPALHRLIFESYIDQCVGGDEPEIKVYNMVDLESIPPHFEFQYSNKMLYHKTVPEPELGLGCDCEGGCSEKSRSCSCLKRQRLYNYDANTDFAYDDRGHLKNAVPIWECGPNCGCPPECMNRVTQRGRGKTALVDLFKTRQKGWGVRARERIASGTFLGIYAGEVIAEEESERRGIIYEKVGRTYLFDCDGYQIANPPKGLEKLDKRLAGLAYDTARRARQHLLDEEEPGTYNAYSIDAFHYGNFTRFFNHSCDPNLQIVQAYVNDFHPERPLLVIFTRRDVRAGEELCISYKGVPEEEEVVEDHSKKSGKRRNIKKPKTTAAAHVNKNVARKDRCYCGAYNCDGIMFNLATEVD